MSEQSLVARPCDRTYLYDGGIQGFYCCVYESVYSRQMPASIQPEQEAQPSLFEEVEIRTDPARADRVRSAVREKISPRALELVEHVFLTCLADKERCILRFLLKGFAQGGRIVSKLGEADVALMLKWESNLLKEAHYFKEFLRFTDYDGVLAATISPKNFVLPFLAGHFTDRLSCERFLIYDDQHHAALIYEGERGEVVPMEDIRFPDVSREEEVYRMLWKRFYQTISIRERENPRCRMTHMPKRYWSNMTEMREALGEGRRSPAIESPGVTGQVPPESPD
ncbi:MAG: TIGR03915 family putative DNA repair protein [Clostridiales bacterium]|nr:TIGR03915 family putative DNA repair protein [Clostridiales bacterium]